MNWNPKFLNALHYLICERVRLVVLQWEDEIYKTEEPITRQQLEELKRKIEAIVGPDCEARTEDKIAAMLESMVADLTATLEWIAQAKLNHPCSHSSAKAEPVFRPWLSQI